MADGVRCRAPGGPGGAGAEWGARTRVAGLPRAATMGVAGRLLGKDGRWGPQVLEGIQGLPE